MYIKEYVCLWNKSSSRSISSSTAEVNYLEEPTASELEVVLDVENGVVDQTYGNIPNYGGSCNSKGRLIEHIESGYLDGPYCSNSGLSTSDNELNIKSLESNIESMNEDKKNLQSSISEHIVNLEYSESGVVDGSFNEIGFTETTKNIPSGDLDEVNGGSLSNEEFLRIYDPDTDSSTEDQTNEVPPISENSLVEDKSNSISSVHEPSTDSFSENQIEAPSTAKQEERIEAALALSSRITGLCYKMSDKEPTFVSDVMENPIDIPMEISKYEHNQDMPCYSKTLNESIGRSVQDIEALTEGESLHEIPEKWYNQRAGDPATANAEMYVHREKERQIPTYHKKEEKHERKSIEYSSDITVQGDSKRNTKKENIKQNKGRNKRQVPLWTKFVQSIKESIESNDADNWILPVNPRYLGTSSDIIRHSNPSNSKETKNESMDEAEWDGNRKFERKMFLEIKESFRSKCRNIFSWKKATA